MIGVMVVDSHSLPRKFLRDSSQVAEKLTVSRDNTFEQTPTSIEADMNS